MSSPVLPLQSTSPRLLNIHNLTELHKCSDPRCLLQIHSQIIRHCLHRNPVIASKLVAAYSLCLRPYSAASVFDLVPEPTSHLFNALIRAFAHNSLPSLSFITFFRMQRSSVKPDSFTYPFLLKSSSAPVRTVELIHAHILKLGFLPDIFVPNSLIDSYSKSGEVVSAKKVFEEMLVKDVVSWNSMVAAFVRAGELRDARRLFDEMPERDIISWNSLLDGYVKAGDLDAAFDLFHRMPARNVVSWSTVVAGYCNRGDMDTARMLFDKMPAKNVVTWTIMISGYASKGLARDASILMDRMEEAGLELDSGAIVGILSACTVSGFLALGRRIHTAFKRRKLGFSIQISNALIDMYSKCGDLDEAWTIFEEMEEKDLVSWNSMVHCLAINGHGRRALQLFSKMEENGIMPDGFTFVGLLCACTHTGLIKEARRYFAIMEKEYGIVPRIEHYGCLIDLLGRGGLLMEAYDVAKTMPFEPNAVVWGSILNACRVHNNVSLAEKIVDELMSLEQSDAGNFAIISNIFAAAGKWDVMAGDRFKMNDLDRRTRAGHEFVIRDEMHSQEDRVLRMLDRLEKHLKKLQYVVEIC